MSSHRRFGPSSAENAASPRLFELVNAPAALRRRNAKPWRGVPRRVRGPYGKAGEERTRVENQCKVARVGVAIAVAGLLSVVSGCEEKKPNLAPVASSLAPSTPPPPGASVRKFTIDGASKTSIEMEAPKEKIKAATNGGTGTLDIDLTNLANSRGEVKMDLSTLTTSTFAEQEKNASQTVHARTWLEVADGESGKLDDTTKQANRYAVYAIRSIENPSVADVTKVAPTKDGADDVRTVTLTTKGELLVHGHKVARDADVEVAFRYDGGAAPDKPKAVTIKTRKPLLVVLAEHDVKPRDGFGKLAKSSFHLLGTKVADNAEIALDLRARP
jgi:polyisoprenoid-binding protein YceI